MVGTFPMPQSVSSYAFTIQLPESLSFLLLPITDIRKNGNAAIAGWMCYIVITGYLSIHIGVIKSHCIASKWRL